MVLLTGLLAVACDDMRDRIEQNTDEILSEAGTAELYVLCEGLFNLNNSTLMRYSFYDSQRDTEYFRHQNKRGLGDTANDLAVYGNKLYVVVNVSSQVEIIDYETGTSLRQIAMNDASGRARQPRSVAFHRNKAYVCSYDGTVSRIDTTTMTVDGVVNVGRNPDGICVSGDKLFVSNSGGLDHPNYDRTVSVIDLTNFQLVHTIEVGENPGKILANEDFVYVMVRERGLTAIDATTYRIAWTYEADITDFALAGDYAYLCVENTTPETNVQRLELTTHAVDRKAFVTDGTQIRQPYAIAVNPYSENIYVSDAYNYQVKGDVLCFNPQGELQFRLNSVGINPTAFVFSSRAAHPSNTTGDSDDRAAFANRVWEYNPAPTQFMNTPVTAYREGSLADDILAYANELINGRSIVSLGAFGGHIVLGFNHRIPNVADAYDFCVYGNAAANSSEPGIVSVSRDDNGNGLPDDPWYELAGSEYGSPHIVRDYEITYYRPAETRQGVSWTDNQGGAGEIPRNAAHPLNEYYPAWIQENTLTFRGTRLPDNAVQKGTNWTFTPFAWGYADNSPNKDDGSKFKIEWAVNENGTPVSLDGIDFVRITSALNQVCGWLGETSTEVSTVEDLHYQQPN
jgi:hypothetical protein